jgi:hypothetical protein
LDAVRRGNSAFVRGRPKVLFIAGADRSGSTLLDVLLGSVNGFVAVGELSNIWQRGIVERRLCGCGAPLPTCEVWLDVLSSVLGHAPHPQDAQTVLSLRARSTRVRHTRRILQGQRPELGRYLAILSRLYTAIARRTNSAVIVDSSKDPSDAAALALTPGVDPFIVHLVRDPRAVAFSRRRRAKVQPDTSEPTKMAERSVSRATLDWLAWNLGTEVVTRTHPERSMLLRYEDFIRFPEDATARLVGLVDGSEPALPFSGPDEAIVGVSHTVSGNPSRFTRGTVRLSVDDEWIVRQPVRDRIVSTAIAAPLMIRYGYPLYDVDADRVRSRRG